MARPLKEGLGYFPVDVDWDDKLASIEMVYGNDGTKWILEFWKAAYKTNEGVVCFQPPLDLLYASKCKIPLDRHKEILLLAINIQFCRELGEGSGIYTSNGIQKRIEQIREERRKAKERKFDKERNKLNINRNEWVPYSGEQPHSSGKQSIVRANNQLSDRITTGKLPENPDDPQPFSPAIIAYAHDECEKAKMLIDRIDKLKRDAQKQTGAPELDNEQQKS
jgi:hypothetical protein